MMGSVPNPVPVQDDRERYAMSVAHGSALAAGNFERLHGRETFEDLAYSEPGYQHEGQEQDHATG